jgi:hypothetical protein
MAGQRQRYAVADPCGRSNFGLKRAPTRTLSGSRFLQLAPTRFLPEVVTPAPVLEPTAASSCARKSKFFPPKSHFFGGFKTEDLPVLSCFLRPVVQIIPAAPRRLCALWKSKHSMKSFR